MITMYAFLRTVPACWGYVRDAPAPGDEERQLSKRQAAAGNTPHPLLQLHSTLASSCVLPAQEFPRLSRAPLLRWTSHAPASADCRQGRGRSAVRNRLMRESAVAIKCRQSHPRRPLLLRRSHLEVHVVSVILVVRHGARAASQAKGEAGGGERRRRACASPSFLLRSRARLPLPANSQHRTSAAVAPAALRAAIAHAPGCAARRAERPAGAPCIRSGWPRPATERRRCPSRRPPPEHPIMQRLPARTCLSLPNTQRRDRLRLRGRCAARAVAQSGRPTGETTLAEMWDCRVEALVANRYGVLLIARNSGRRRRRSRRDSQRAALPRSGQRAALAWQCFNPLGRRTNAVWNCERPWWGAWRGAAGAAVPRRRDACRHVDVDGVLTPLTCSRATGPRQRLWLASMPSCTPAASCGSKVFSLAGC